MTSPSLDSTPLRTRRISEERDDLDWAKRGQFWQCQSTPKANRTRSGSGKIPTVLTLSGHGVRLNVEHGTLVIQNGFTHYPQKREIWRLFAGQRNLPGRIVMLDGSGALSFDVLAWLSEQQIPLIQINWEGQVITVLGNTSHSANPVLVEAQRAAANSGRGLELSRDLIKEKIQGCRANLSAFDPSTARDRVVDKLQQALDELAYPVISVETLRLIEGRAALAYFGYWQTRPLQWKGIARKPIPDNWKHMGARQSPVSGTNRNATHPVNAMLNYVYGMLESQVRIATVVAGLDPTIGFLHANRSGRVAFVYDLMEPLRPKADALLLNFLLEHKFSPGDFVLNELGVCRLHPQFSKIVASLVVQPILVETLISDLVKRLTEVQELNFLEAALL